MTLAPHASPVMAAAATLVVAQTPTDPPPRRLDVLSLTRGSLRDAGRVAPVDPCGAMGALASAGWFTAFALEPVAHVRTLALIEIVFSYAVSRRFFRESVARNELWGLILLALGIVFIVNAG